MIRHLCVGLILVLIAATPAQAQMVSVARAKVNLRAGPGLNQKVLWELGQGYPLRVLERKGPWLKVKDFENDGGWILEKLVDSQAHLVAKKERINIRGGPGETHPVAGTAAYGEVLRTLEQGKGWVRVKTDSGLTGWVRKDLVWGW